MAEERENGMMGCRQGERRQRHFVDSTTVPAIFVTVILQYHSVPLPNDLATKIDGDGSGQP